MEMQKKRAKGEGEGERLQVLLGLGDSVAPSQRPTAAIPSFSSVSSVKNHVGLPPIADTVYANLFDLFAARVPAKTATLLCKQDKPWQNRILPYYNSTIIPSFDNRASSQTLPTAEGPDPTTKTTRKLCDDGPASCACAGMSLQHTIFAVRTVNTTVVLHYYCK